MTIVLREIPREAADAILAGERPGDVRVADDYPTEFSAGVARAVGTEGQVHYFVHRLEDDVVVGEIGAAFVDDEGTIEIGYAVVESQHNRGYATAGGRGTRGEGARGLGGASHRRPHAARAPRKRPRAREGRLRDGARDG